MVYRKRKDTCANADDTAVEAVTVVTIVQPFAILTHRRPAYLPRLHYHYFVVAEWWK